MFFIAGTKGETSTADTGTFYCPSCEQETAYHHEQVHEKVTVFFVPVASLRLLGEYIECQECFDTFKMEVLSIDEGEDDFDYESYLHLAIKRILVLMMLADGKIDDSEKIMIKDIMKDITDDELSDAEIQEDINLINEEPDNPESFLKTMFPHMNEQGRELVYKACYCVSISDGELDVSEEKLLKSVAKILQLSNAHIKGIEAEINESN